MSQSSNKQSTRVALVTGGSRGIGLGIAEALAAEGLNLVVNGVRDESAASQTLDKLRRIGGQVVYARGDVSDADDRRAILDTVRQSFGRLDVLINNAGVAPRERADILEAGETSFDRLISINLKGPYFLTQAAANWMIEQRKADERFSGTIVNVSSVSATVASVNRGDYCISKAGIAMATMLWAARLAEHDIDVFELRPGVIETDMTAGVKAKYDKLISEGLTLQRRWGRPEDIGKVAAALVRGDMPYATGQVINIDGGMTIQTL